MRCAKALSRRMVMLLMMIMLMLMLMLMMKIMLMNRLIMTMTEKHNLVYPTLQLPFYHYPSTFPSTNHGIR